MVRPKQLQARYSYLDFLLLDQQIKRAHPQLGLSVIAVGITRASSNPAAAWSVRYSASVRSCPPGDETYTRNFLRLLRINGTAKREEHGAKSEDCDFFLHVFFLSRFTCDVTLTPSHLITLSALISTFCGIVTPICFAVFRLIIKSNFVGCSTGRSAGFLPLKNELTRPL